MKLDLFFPVATQHIRLIVVAILCACTVSVGLRPGELCRAAEGADEIPEPENITLETKDLLLLKCTWYAGWKGKKSVPILMLHGAGGNRNDYAPLAEYLQKQGHAVLVPDLRGHGGSTKFKGGAAPKHKSGVDLTPKEIQASYYAMVEFDIETCKKFLNEQNNMEQLNIDLLCVMAADTSTVLALHWAVKDWSAPVAAAFRDGQDVKALILLSPLDKIEKSTLSTVAPLKYPVIQGKGAAVRLSILIAVGSEDRKSNTQAKTMYTALKAHRKEPELKDMLKDQQGASPADKEEALKKEIEKNQDLFFDPYDTELQGTKLLDPKHKLGIEKRISNFIVRRLASKESDFPWQKRARPF